MRDLWPKNERDLTFFFTTVLQRLYRVGETYPLFEPFVGVFEVGQVGHRAARRPAVPGGGGRVTSGADSVENSEIIVGARLRSSGGRRVGQSVEYEIVQFNGGKLGGACGLGRARSRRTEVMVRFGSSVVRKFRRHVRPVGG